MYVKVHEKSLIYVTIYVDPFYASYVKYVKYKIDFGFISQYYCNISLEHLFMLVFIVLKIFWYYESSFCILPSYDNRSAFRLRNSFDCL